MVGFIFISQKITLKVKPNTSAHLKPTSWVFKQFSRRLFSWQSMIIFLLLDKLARKKLTKAV